MIPSQEFVLAEVHPLNDVSTVVEHSADVFCVHCTCEVWIAVMPAISACRTYPLWKQGSKKKIQGSGAMPWQVSHLSSHSLGKSVYRSLKKVNKRKGGLWSGQSEWQIWNEDYKMQWILLQGQDRSPLWELWMPSSAAQAVAICASLCSQICAADSCAACHAAAPGIVFSSFFGAIIWQILDLLF